MMRLWRIACAVVLCGGIASAQSDKEEREKQRQFEREVSKAISEFKKTYSKNDVDVAEGMKQLAQYKHEKVIKEIARWVTADWKICAKTAIEILAEKRHPDSAKALAAAWAKWVKDKEIVTVLQTATSKFQFDEVTMASHKLLDEIFNQDVGSLVYGHLGHLKKIRSCTSVEPLIALLKKVDDAIQQNSTAGGNNDGNNQFRKELISTLTVISGQKYDTHSDWESWWKRSKAQFYSKVVIVHWCERSWELWEKTAEEKKKCPHHQDEKRRGRWKELPCMYKPL